VASLGCVTLLFMLRRLQRHKAAARDTGHLLHWSAWRRRHQRTARACHDQRQAACSP
jgi:hypothetical protein